jgi:hypothetical protein
VGIRRIAELVAMLMIGEGVLTIIAPRRHSLLWEFGPEGYNRAIEAFAEHPILSRLVAAAETGLGLWLAFRVYSQEDEEE